MPLILSVVICTYNRADMLEGCLKSLSTQTAPLDSFQIIVIDNNSDDDTRNVVQRYFGNPNFKYVLEPITGLSHARNKGLKETRSEYIAYLDDDCLPPPRWVENAINIINENPNLDGMGGPLYPFYTTHKPDWYEEAYDAQMSSKETYFLEPGHGFIGANMIWKREVLESIGGFREEFGLVGDSLKYIGLGEETDAYQRAWLMKPSASFLFTPELNMKHWVPPWKMNLAYRFRRLFFAGYYGHQISGPYSFFSRSSYIFVTAVDLLKTAIKAGWAASKYSHWKKWANCELRPIMINLGKIYSAMGLKISRKS